MSNTQPPKDRFDHILDFFFGSPKSTKRTFIGIGIILVLIFIKDLIEVIKNVAYEIIGFAINLVNQYAGAAILIAVLIFGIKTLLRRK